MTLENPLTRLRRELPRTRGSGEQPLSSPGSAGEVPRSGGGGLSSPGSAGEVPRSGGGGAAPTRQGTPGRWGGWLRHLPLVLGAVLMLFPLWWMLVVSLETEQRAGMAMLGGDVVQVWPEDPQWHNYTDAMREVGSAPWIPFLDALANSIVVTVSVIIGTVLSCSLVGFAFARVRFRGRGWMFLLMLATMMLPAQVTMIPLFLLFRSMGWVDTLLPLIVPAFFGSAFNIFLYRQFIAGIPEALLEAGRLDGLGWLGLWWRIVLPLCTPVTAIVAVFSFIYTWNDFMSPLIYLHSESNYTLAIALNSFRTQYAGLEDVHLLMALSVVTMIPCILLFLAAQKQFIEGLGSGAVKG